MASTSRRACLRPRQAYRMLRMAYRMLQYWIRRRSAISYVFWRCEPTTSEPYVRYRIIPMLHCTSYATSSKNVRYCIRCRTSKWQETGKNVRYRTFYGDIVRCTYDVVQKTYDVVYDIVYDIARTTGKKRVKTYDIVRFLAISYVVRTMSSKKHTMSYTTSYTTSHVRLARNG